MNWSRSIQRMAMVVSVSLWLAACASRPPAVNTDVIINFPSADPVTSVEQADQVLENVALAKAQINWRYQQKEQICYDKFFVNHCLLAARDERRTDLARVKQVEVAANYFKRRDQVEQMDRNLYEKNLATPLPDPDPTKATQQDEPADSTDTPAVKSMND